MWGTTALRAVPLLGAFPIVSDLHSTGVSLLFALVLALGCGLAVRRYALAAQLAGVDPLTALAPAPGARLEAGCATR